MNQESTDENKNIKFDSSLLPLNFVTEARQHGNSPVHDFFCS